MKKLTIIIALCLFIASIIFFLFFKENGKNQLVIETASELDTPITITQVFLESEVILYDSQTIKSDNIKIEPSLSIGESHIVLKIKNQEKIIMGYIDSNNQKLEIKLVIKKGKEGELVVDVSSKTELSPTNEQFIFE